MLVERKCHLVFFALCSGISSNVLGEKSMKDMLEKADRLMESIYKTGDFISEVISSAKVRERSCTCDSTC